MPDLDRLSPRCKPGDLWRLGPHRLVCGDALNPAVVAALMGSEEAEMVFPDPPDNLAIEGNVSGLEWDRMWDQVEECDRAIRESAEDLKQRRNKQIRKFIEDDIAHEKRIREIIVSAIGERDDADPSRRERP